MKILLLLTVFCAAAVVHAQNLQLHYDFRHSIDPKLNPVNYPTFTFEYFKNLDSAKGSFLIKIRTDMNGANNNVGQVFTQISQNLRFWKPRVQLSLAYSGGLGLAPPSYGFYVNNAFGIGGSYFFQYKGAFLSTNLLLRYSAFSKPSYDPQFTFYFGRGFNNYKVFLSGSFTFWTQNNNLGDDATANLRGKKLAFFGDPQLWVRVYKNLALGTRINVFYHVLTDDNQVQFYPTLGAKYQF